MARCKVRRISFSPNWTLVSYIHLYWCSYVWSLLYYCSYIMLCMFSYYHVIVISLLYHIVIIIHCYHVILCILYSYSYIYSQSCMSRQRHLEHMDVEVYWCDTMRDRELGKCQISMEKLGGAYLKVVGHLSRCGWDARCSCVWASVGIYLLRNICDEISWLESWYDK